MQDERGLPLAAVPVQVKTKRDGQTERFSTTVRSWPNACVSWFCASWNFLNSAGFDRSSVVMLMLVAAARALVTLVRMVVSDCAAPRTEEIALLRAR